MLDKKFVKIVENRAQQERGRFGLGNESKIGNSIFSILETKYNALIFLYPLKNTKIAGFTRKNEDLLQVFINTSLPKSYQIFAAAHELYHVIDIKEKDFILCDTDDVSDLSNKSSISIDELKANYFAASYLLPDNVIFERFDSFSSYNYSLKDLLVIIVKLQFEYEVPYKTIIRRLEELEVIEDSSIIQNLMEYEFKILQFCKLIDEEIYNKIQELESISKRIYHTLSTPLTAIEVYKGGLLSYNKLNDILDFYNKDINETDVNEPEIVPIDFGSIELGDDDEV